MKCEMNNNVIMPEKILKIEKELNERNSAITHPVLKLNDDSKICKYLLPCGMCEKYEKFCDVNKEIKIQYK